MKRYTIFVVVLMLSYHFLFGQESDSIYIMVDELPSFPGGDIAKIKFLEENVEYPQMAMEKRIQGNVHITFVIEKDGTITNVKLFRGVERELDEEAIRVVKMMPKWNPGKINGKLVRVQSNLPVIFLIERGVEKNETKKIKKEKWYRGAVITEDNDTISCLIKQKILYSKMELPIDVEKIPDDYYTDRNEIIEEELFSIKGYIIDNHIYERKHYDGEKYYMERVVT